MNVEISVGEPRVDEDSEQEQQVLEQQSNQGHIECQSVACEDRVKKVAADRIYQRYFYQGEGPVRTEHYEWLVRRIVPKAIAIA